MSCTWVDCSADAEVDQVGKDGSVWAKLCREHHDKLEGTIRDGDVRRMLSYWVRAQGGAKAAAKKHEADSAVIAKRIGDALSSADWADALRKK